LNIVVSLPSLFSQHKPIRRQIVVAVLNLRQFNPCEKSRVSQPPHHSNGGAPPCVVIISTALSCTVLLSFAQPHFMRNDIIVPQKEACFINGFMWILCDTCAKQAS